MPDKFDDALVGVGMSKAEKKRYKRQQKLLKKFGIRDENTMGKIERFFYLRAKKRRIKKKKRMSRSAAGDISLFLLYIAQLVKKRQKTDTEIESKYTIKKAIIYFIISIIAIIISSDLLVF